MTPTKISKALGQARSDMASANDALAALDAQKAEALRNSKAFAQWSVSHEAAKLEVERLALLVEQLETDLAREQNDAVAAARAARRAELETQSAALAQRISKEGSEAAVVLVRLAEEAKANAEAVERFNRELGNDDAPLFSGDYLARYSAPAPRQDIAEAIIDLWVFESSGELVGDQDAVVEREGGRGVIPPTMRSLHPVRVVRRRFRQITFLEPGERQHLEPLASALQLPNFAGPGLLYARGRAIEPVQRRELLELIPADDAPAEAA